MLFRPREYFRPSSIEEAVSLLIKYGDKAKPLAGGTDIMVDKPANIDCLVDITALPLRYIKNGKDGLRIGSLTTFRDLETSDLLGKGAYSILVEAAQKMGSVAIKNVATIGGNICNALPSAELPPALIVLGARLNIFGPDGERSLNLKEFFKGIRKTDLKPGELVTEICVPTIPEHTGTAFLTFNRVSVDLSTIVVAVRVSLRNDGTCRDTRIAIGGGVGPTCFLFAAPKSLQENRINDHLLEDVAERISEEIKPRPSSIRGSIHFKKTVTKNLVKRALKQALAKIGEE